MFLESSQLSLKRYKHNFGKDQADILLRNNRLHSLLHELQLGLLWSIAF